MTDRKTEPEKDGKSPPPQKAHLPERRDDQSRRATAEQAHSSRNAGQTGNIRQNTHNQGYQQDR